MKIGNFETENNVFLAPMAGVTDLPFRKICRRYGAGLVYSEMVSAKGLYYNDKKTADLMRIDDEERPCAIQIFGSDADIMAEVIPKVMAVKPDIIDINMGCPDRAVEKQGAGAAMMKDKEKAGMIIQAVKDGIKDSLGIYSSPDKFAEFKLDESVLKKALNDLKIKKGEIQDSTRRSIILTFTVDENGLVDKDKIHIRGLEIPKNLMQKIKDSKLIFENWKPAEHKGETVKSDVNLRIQIEK